MTAGGDPAALGQLLRSRRERLVPADVGLPAGGSAGRRRTAGLRREEVAMLASLSVTYYTFLEQGRPVRPSPTWTFCEQVNTGDSPAFLFSFSDAPVMKALSLYREEKRA